MVRIVRIIIVILVYLLSNIAFSLSRYVLPCRADLLEESFKMMQRETGTIEKTVSGQARIKEYLKAVGLAKSNPYCAAGQYWCFSKAISNLNLPHSTIPIPRSGLASSFFNYAKSKGNRTAFKPKMHDLIIWRKGTTKFGHVERIVSVQSGGWVESIGFNTNKVIDGKAEKGVFLHRRNVYHSLGRMAIRGLAGFITEPVYD